MKRIFKIITMFVLMTSWVSCIEPQDFDQYQDLEITPTLAASLLYYEVSETAINTLPPGVLGFSEDYNFDAFNEDFIADRVIEGSITYQVVNTTSKSLEIMVTYLDENGVVLDSADLSVGPASDEPIVLDRSFVYNETDTQRIIKNISSIRVSLINRGDNTTQSNLDDPKIILKSSAEFKIRLK